MKVKYEKPFVCNSSYKSILGQRPIWDWRHDKLLWIDIHENKIIETDQNVQEENYYLIPEGVTNILLQDNENYLMSSFDSLFSLHSSIEETYIVALTANASSQDKLNCKQAGMDMFIAKPFKLPAIEEAIINTLKRLGVATL